MYHGTAGENISHFPLFVKNSFFPSSYLLRHLGMSVWVVCVVYDEQLSAGGFEEGKGTSVGLFLKEPSPYLRKEIRGLKKTTTISERL